MGEGQLKEFLYVDVDRTRSLLAQMQGGVIEGLTSETANTLEGMASASFFGIGGKGGYAREARHQESRSFQEMIFVAFEALADERALISDLEDDFRDSDSWKTGEIHSRLAEGQLIRIQCDVQILDGSLFGERIARFEKMADGVLRFMDQPSPKHSSTAQRKQLVRQTKQALMGGVTSDQLSAISEFVDAFVGEGISMRALPCGEEHLELGFGGALLGRREYIQEERETLFSRYGTVASSWTCVMQVAAIPENTEESEDREDVAEGVDKAATGVSDAAPAAAKAVVTNDGSTSVGDESSGADASSEDDGEGDGFSRPAMERMAVALLTMMEQCGVVEGPRWPTISVTPLAVYRNIPSG